MLESDIKFLLSEDVQQYVDDNLNKDVATLLLAASPYSKAEKTAIVSQIQARRKAQTKLPVWFANSQIIYPALLSMEQCSSETSATYKAQLLSGRTMADLTGGLGVDCYYFSKHFGKVHYIEQQEELAAIVQHNLAVLGVTNIQVHQQTAEYFIEHLEEKLDVIYLDPARRDNAKNKVFRLEDCTPNLLELLPKIWQKTEQVLVKLSPMLDIDLGVKQLKNVAKVVVVAVNNECKELLFLLKNDCGVPPVIQTVNLSTSKPVQEFSFSKEEEIEAQIRYAEPSQYLYEPNVAILKAGAFKKVAEVFGLAKLHLHSHLYTSSTLVSDFPGRIFKVKSVCKYSKKEVVKHCPSKKANVTTRNFPDSVALVRKKLQLKDGGNDYVFCTQTQAHRALVIITERV